MKPCHLYVAKSGSNLLNYDAELHTHDQEEVDTLIILHTTDTDVLVLLIYFYKEPCNQIRLFSGNGKNKREVDIGNT